MHEHENRYQLRIAREFIEGLSIVYSERLLTQIRGILETLQVAPEIGSAHVRDSLIARYGTGIRKIPVSTFVIVYRIVGETVDVLALVYGPRIR